MFDVIESCSSADVEMNDPTMPCEVNVDDATRCDIFLAIEYLFSELSMND